MGEQVRGEMGGETVGSTVRKVSKHWEKTSLLVDSTIANKHIAFGVRRFPTLISTYGSVYTAKKKKSLELMALMV
jgi:hypothetical protein